MTGNDKGNGSDVKLEFLSGSLGSTSLIPTVHQPDVKCCTWILYLSFFLLSCVIIWFIVTSLVLSFHVYRRSQTISSWYQRCINKRRRNPCQDTKIEIHYHHIIQYDVAKMPLLSDVNELWMDGRKGWFGASMKDYIFSKPPMPICPELEMGPNRSGDPGSQDSKHCDR
ncbi:uncharacterized protein LOC753915 [Strongylocentrotus purpuratus]|uniref:Uncharacterized protein n=1 Tax=Strongylocentrotus purpuratus TaxID=7668 RepID=A0A7M7G9K2_STRPU|nr:uncharacterized protein LOC753915 [Strongylocentrotus purpuratus]|eukprot:XP_001183727.1 PREDICTED: uncharacterized protein LOC753915 [Strongylocentrotus purpuratus]